MVSNGSICVSRLPQVLLASRWSMQPDSLCPTTSMLLLNLSLAGSTSYELCSRHPGIASGAASCRNAVLALAFMRTVCGRTNRQHVIGFEAAPMMWCCLHAGKWAAASHAVRQPH